MGQFRHHVFRRWEEANMYHVQNMPKSVTQAENRLWSCEVVMLPDASCSNNISYVILI